MAETAPKILEGVFAISKPPSLSSAQVLRDLQNKFAVSETFAPLLEDTQRKQAEQERHQGKRRKRGNDQFFKMGHGGTLDPLATGVLIVGIGRGTKHLQNFLGCTKTYDTVVLFGKATDTYDAAGKIVGEAGFKHITRELVESKLPQFRGAVAQVPPVYSALKINGMKAYEYAREGRELPRELESREIHVDECTLLDWFPGGEHDYRWPAREASEEERKAVSKLMGTANSPTKAQDEAPSVTKDDHQSLPPEQSPVDPEPPTLSQFIPSSPKKQNFLPAPVKASLHTHDHTLLLSPDPSPAPAALIRITASSGFYVRSFAHDLGHAVQSQGIMASLLRSRQASFTTVEPPSDSSLIPCLTYADLAAGEPAWGPKLTAQLTRWMAENPAADRGHVNGRDPETKRRLDSEDRARPKQRFRGGREADSRSERIQQQGGRWKGKWNEGGNRGKMHERAEESKRGRVRNSSSPE